MTLNDIISTLQNAGIENPTHEAVLIASHFTGRSSASLLCDRALDISSDSALTDKINDAVSRRCSREPLQYILGSWNFMGLDFEVTEDCLIPREDTELLCECAISRMPEGASFLDLCTGSGCIAVSVAHHRPDVSVSALEKYPQTLNVARKNAKALLGGKRSVRFVEADVTSHISALGNFGAEKFDFIASNPPYVTVSEMDLLAPELAFEPRHALTDEGDGLSIIRAIIRIYPAFLKENGCLAIEHGSTQGEAVRALFKEAGYDSETLCDLGGKARVTIMQNK